MKSWLLLELQKFLHPKFFLVATVFALALFFTVLWQWPDNNLHLISCDVGQGDATLITYKFSQLLIDGGPDTKVLDCLSKYMPFWDRNLEMVVSTHPQDDHLAGLIPVVNRYGVRYFVLGEEGNTTASFQELLRVLVKKQPLGQIKILNLFAGDRVNVGGITAEVLWPQHDWLSQNITLDDTKNPPKTVGKSVVLGAKATAELNDYSYVMRIKYGSSTFLLPGDADSNLDPLLLASNMLSSVTVLKYPHHGSRTGATKEFLQAVSPQLALISVGAKNRYGHPAPETLDLLGSLKIRFLRTDLVGDIEVVTNGEKWWVKPNKPY